jgi:lyso-ornithine lipid O-acyltransferase
MTSVLLADSLMAASYGAPRGPRATAVRVKWLCENVSALHGLEVRATGAVPKGPCALVANHLSYLDPLAIASLVPLTAVAKEEVGDWPVIGRALRELGLLFVDRACAMSGARTLRAAGRCFAAGLPVLVFPEGTTTAGRSVLPFRRGIFGMAAKMSVPVVPVSLRYDVPAVAWTGDDAFFPHYLRTASRETTRVDLHFAAPIETSPRDRAEDLAALARRTIAEHLCMTRSPSSSSLAA